MEEFLVYVSMGFQHILDPEGLDHFLFIVTLCAVFKLHQWKNVLVLVTAFTLGHSITLALSSLNLVSINANIIEFLIPVTILTTAVLNVKRNSQNRKAAKFIPTYLLALGFGLIHGLGFSNYFKAIMMGQDSITFPLFSFNLGIEIGQIIIVGLVFSSLYFYSKMKEYKHHNWNLILSGAGGGVACTILIEKIFLL